MLIPDFKVSCMLTFLSSVSKDCPLSFSIELVSQCRTNKSKILFCKKNNLDSTGTQKDERHGRLGPELRKDLRIFHLQDLP